jgi:hypothetical protein
MTFEITKILSKLVQTSSLVLSTHVTSNSENMCPVLAPMSFEITKILSM